MSATTTRRNGTRNNGNLNNGTAPVQPAVPTAPTLAELRAMQATLKDGPHTGAEKRTTQAFIIRDGVLAKATMPGHATDKSPDGFRAFVFNAPAVSVQTPVGEPFTDPKTGTAKRHLERSADAPGASVAPFLADVVSPVVGD